MCSRVLTWLVYEVGRWCDLARSVVFKHCGPLLLHKQTTPVACTVIGHVKQVIADPGGRGRLPSGAAVSSLCRSCRERPMPLAGCGVASPVTRLSP